MECVKFTKEDNPNVSWGAFDFICDCETADEWNTLEREIENAVYKCCCKYGCEFLGIDFDSVDYSDYPEFADERVTQCQFDFGWVDPYAYEELSDDIEFAINSLYCDFIGGVEFESGDAGWSYYK